MDLLNDALDSISNLDEFEIYVCGDINIPYTKGSTSTDFRKLKAFEHKYVLTQMIDVPTRCTSRTSNTLDLVFTNSKFIARAGTDELNISDHEPAIVIRKKQHRKTKCIDFECRSFAHYVKEEFQEDLLGRSWDEYYATHDVNTSWDMLYNIIKCAADRHCPVKTYKRKKEIAPWLTKELLELMYERDRIYKLAKRTALDADWIAARKIRNKGIRQAKCSFAQAQLEIHEKNPNKFWSAIEKIWKPATDKDTMINLVDQDSGIPIPLVDVPNTFNEHLCRVGEKLARQFVNAPPSLSTR